MSAGLINRSSSSYEVDGSVVTAEMLYHLSQLLTQKVGQKGAGKYHAHRMEVFGHRFDSKREVKRFLTLLTWLHKEEIRNLELQPQWKLKGNGDFLRYPPTPRNSKGRIITYAADFRYVNIKENRIIVEDVKGFDTDMSRIKRGLLWSLHGIQVEIIK